MVFAGAGIIWTPKNGLWLLFFDYILGKDTSWSVGKSICPYWFRNLVESFKQITRPHVPRVCHLLTSEKKWWERFKIISPDYGAHISEGHRACLCYCKAKQCRKHPLYPERNVARSYFWEALPALVSQSNQNPKQMRICWRVLIRPTGCIYTKRLKYLPLTVSMTSFSPTPTRGTTARHTYFPASSCLTAFSVKVFSLLSTCKVTDVWEKKKHNATVWATS